MTTEPVLSESAGDLYENAPCGYVVAGPDRRIVNVNTTLLTWLGYERNALIGKPFTDLLAVGSLIHYETHFAPLLQLQGQLAGVTVDLKTADGSRLPVFVTANVKSDGDGRPVLLRITFHDAGIRRSYERELLDERQRVERERARVQIFARTLQRTLLPPLLSPPQGLDASALYHAASVDDVGGDFYDLFPLAQDKWAFFIGDVSGKGAGAAAVTSLTRYTLRAAAAFDADPIEVLQNLHTVLSQEFRDTVNQFATVVFGVLTPRDGEFDVQLASGGHLPPLVLGANGEARYTDTVGGHPVGIPMEPRFVATRIRLGAGDTLVLYTDGLTEARVGSGTERYDFHGALLEFAAEHAPATASAIVAEIQSLLDGFGSGLEDDVAVLALGVPR
ncbi:SpoIIE family protein phosphatase [Mycobacterium sp.]|uniref:SpoIIE family protein phosphatase n=1 Tax=Mycobacterium sp. TaxID=1785 RepID=UPI0025E0D5CA|nr:SpoIIE family protein phosphatase [Mycobacterium sp.]